MSIQIASECFHFSHISLRICSRCGSKRFRTKRKTLGRKTKKFENSLRREKIVENIIKQQTHKRLLMSRNLSKMSKNILAVLSTGSEEMEFTITVDILRRAGVSCAGT